MRLVTAGAIVLASGAGALFACSSDDTSVTFMGDEAGTDASLGPFGSDSGSPAASDDAGPPPVTDAAPPPSCPGTALPSTASTACVIDTSNGCPSCASWGYSCPSATSPAFQTASASGLCRAAVVDAGDGGGSLICCTRPMCVASDLDGGCEGGATKRYECSGGAVPTGTCTWSGPSSPNDYCCQ